MSIDVDAIYKLCEFLLKKGKFVIIDRYIVAGLISADRSLEPLM